MRKRGAGSAGKGGVVLQTLQILILALLSTSVLIYLASLSFENLLHKLCLAYWSPSRAATLCTLSDRAGRVQDLFSFLELARFIFLTYIASHHAQNSC